MSLPQQLTTKLAVPKQLATVCGAAVLALSSSTFSIGTVGVGAGVALMAASPAAMADGISYKEARQLRKLERQVRRALRKMKRAAEKESEAYEDAMGSLDKMEEIICGVADCP